MDVNVTRVQSGLDQEAKERQWSEGCCFLCNKQGHLKRNCPTSRRGNSSTKISLMRLITKEAQVEQEKDGDFEDTKMTQHRRDRLMTKLCGMSMQERDKVIDALINQKDFWQVLSEQLCPGLRIELTLCILKESKQWTYLSSSTQYKRQLTRKPSLIVGPPRILWTRKSEAD